MGSEHPGHDHRAPREPGVGDDLEGVRGVVVTASDGVDAGARTDASGAALTSLLEGRGATVTGVVVPDEVARIRHAVDDAGRLGARLVVVTGGTGLGPRDVTPEALAGLGGRTIPGFGERMRAAGRATTPMADLSRSLAVAVGEVLVLGVPGSPRGAVQSVEAVVGLVPHVLDLLVGDTEHAAPTRADTGDDHWHMPAHLHDDHEHHDHDEHHGDAGHEHEGHEHDPACDAAHTAGRAEHGTLMVVFASPLAAVLAAWGRELGWEPVLVDPTRSGADPDGLRVVADCSGADPETDIVVTDHGRDELVDVLDGALDTPARFIGLMGSKRHAGPHVAPLRDRGRGDDELARIVRPIGIDIGSRTPPEIAVSTLADLVARRRGRH